MCLTVDISRHLFNMAKITLRPITCYKGFRVEDHIVQTPFRHMCITTPHLLFGMRCKKMRKKIKCRDWWINKGIHACTTREAAEEKLDYLKYKFPDEEFIVVKMVIPAFTWYWIGDDDDICSQHMIFSESAKTIISNLIN